jgi:dolichyl-phosphate-mannose-protein mannosyltransferase
VPPDNHRSVLHWPYLWLCAILYVTVFFHAVTLSQPSEPVFDEGHYVNDAWTNIIQSQPSDTPEHPPVGKLLIAGGELIFGNNPLGWRVLPVLFGTITLALFWFICRRLGLSLLATNLSTTFLAFENLSFVQASIAMLDVFMVTFMMASFWLYLKELYWLSALAVVLSSLAKLSGVLSLGVIFLHWLLSGRKKPMSFLMSMALAPVAFLVSLPLLNIIVMRQLLNPWQSVAGMLGKTLKMTFAGWPLSVREQASRPWEWIVSNGREVYTSNPSYIAQISPTVWILIVPALAYVIWRSFKREDAAIFALAWFVGTYLFWIPADVYSDRLTYIWYFYPTVGMVCMGIGAGLGKLLKPDGTLIRGRIVIPLILSVSVLVLSHFWFFVRLSPVFTLNQAYPPVQEYRGLTGKVDLRNQNMEPAIGLPDNRVSPSVQTISAVVSSASTVRRYGNLTRLGDNSIVEVSFLLAGAPASTNYDHETTVGQMSNGGVFSADLSGLEPATTYFYRAKAAGQTATFGDEMQFTTYPLTDQGRIAFADAGIWWDTPDGRNLTWIVRAPMMPGSDTARIEGYPTWSSDGTKIAFVGMYETEEILVVNADGTGIRRLHVIGTNPSWSPDGAKIAYSSLDVGWGIYVMDADGSHVIRLTDKSAFSSDNYPAWSPDSSKILFSSTRDGRPELYTMDPDGQNQTRLTQNTVDEEYPAWSPDASMIAFESQKEQAVYVMKADGTSLIQVAGNASHPAWSPDGKKIVFESSRYVGNDDLSVMDSNGDNKAVIRAGLAQHPAWAVWRVVPAS